MTSLEEWVGLAIDIARRDWLGLPWKTDPNGSTAVDWKPVLPGTYYFAKADGR